MAKRSRDRPRLSQAEWAVMKALWDGGPMAVGDIYERLSTEQDWAYTTARTLVRRLADKGWLSYRKVGSSFLYRAAVPRDKAVRSAVREFSERVLGGLLSPFVAYYAEEKGLSQDDVAKLRKIIDTDPPEGGKQDDISSSG